MNANPPQIDAIQSFNSQIDYSIIHNFFLMIHFYFLISKVEISFCSFCQLEFLNFPSYSHWKAIYSLIEFWNFEISQLRFQKFFDFGVTYFSIY